jgi:hypothetical protein
MDAKGNCACSRNIVRRESCFHSTKPVSLFLRIVIDFTNFLVGFFSAFKEYVPRVEALLSNGPNGVDFVLFI